MTYVSHSLLDRYPVAGHACDHSDAGGMEREVRTYALPVSLQASFEKEVPISRDHFWKDTGALSACILQLTNQRQEIGVKGSGVNLRAFGVKSDAPGFKVDVTEGHAGFTNSASLEKRDFERDCHPAVAQRQMAFLHSECLANCCNVGVGHLGLFRRPLLLDAHAFKRTRGDEPAMHSLAHDAREESQLGQCGVVGRMLLRNSLNLARPPRHVFKAKLVGHPLWAANFLLRQKRIDPLPSVAFGNHSVRVALVFHLKPGHHPAVPLRGRRYRSGGERISGKLTRDRHCTFVAERVVTTVVGAFRAEAQFLRAPEFDPPIRRVLSGVNTGANQTHLTRSSA